MVMSPLNLALLDLDPCPRGDHAPDGQRSPFDIFQVHADGRRCLGGLALDGFEQRLCLLQHLGILVGPGRL